MAGIEVSIAGSEKLTNIFGYWPSFHDAEVLELHFSRGDVRPSEGKYEFPILRLKIHLWALTKEVHLQGVFCFAESHPDNLEVHGCRRI
jgi:hypothetical protein